MKKTREQWEKDKAKLYKTLSKTYPSWYKKIRRVIINLYRPIAHDKWNSPLNQHPMAYIMFLAFAWTAVLTYQDSPDYWIPFMSAFCVIPTSWIYLKFWPQTWDEMKDYEKDAFKQIWNLSKDFKPEDLK
tara:strand:+ start:604 stop:993 length:390 start_codon:yes stop_codon:yes gene_type:complete